MRKTGRKHRALERIKANQNFVDREFQKRLDKATAPGKREQTRNQVEEFLVENPHVSTRKLERRFEIHRDTAAKIRDDLGFVVPKKDYRCHKARYDNAWPTQPGERPGICACGCGNKTTQALNNNSTTGMRAGQFYRFIAGHQWLLRRKLQKPKGWKSSHDVNRERDCLRVTLLKAASKLPRYTAAKVATFEDLRNRVKKIELQGRPVQNQQMSRMMTVGRFMPEVICLDIPRFVIANEVTTEEWRQRLVSVSLSLGKTEIDIEQFRRLAGESSNRRNHVISRLLSKAKQENDRIPLVLVNGSAPRYKPAPPISECYPFGKQDDLLDDILSVIPSHYSTEIRADLAQDIALAVLSGECARDEIPSRLSEFITKFYKTFGLAGYGHTLVSMDAKISDEPDSRSLHELIDGQQAMTELYGGTNWETREQWFEKAKEFDGKVVAHY